MANIIPPLVSSTPPPMNADDDEDDDEFGDFAAISNDLSYGCDGFSLPTTPQHSGATPSFYPDLPVEQVSTGLAVARSDVNDSSDIKDNTSQDSVLSIVTSDSGLSSENVISSSDEVLPNGAIKTNDKCIDDESISVVTDDTKCESNNIVDEKNIKNSKNMETNKQSIIANNSSEVLSSCVKENSVESLKIISECSENLTNDKAKSLNEVILLANNVNRCYDSFLTDEPPPLDKNDEEYNRPDFFDETEDDDLFNFTKSENSFGEAESPNGDDKVLCADDFSESSKDYRDKRKADAVQLDNGELKTNDSETVNFDNVIPLTKIVKDDNSDSANVCQKQETQNEDGDLDGSEDFESFACFSSEFNQPQTNACPSDVVNLNNDVNLTICDQLSMNNKIDSDDEDDFADFETANVFEKNEPSQNVQTPEKQESKDDFADFESAVSQKIEADDDFNDFECASTYSEAPLKSEATTELNRIELFIKKTRTIKEQEEVIKTIKDIFEEVFPIEESTIHEDAQNIQPLHNFINKNMWRSLTDLENTAAMKLQWTDSESSKALLKALKIDSRNILHGPRWNTSVPRFAANLAVSPLEPLKPIAVALQPSSTSTSPAVSSDQVQPVSEDSVIATEVPAAQFDWNDAGLINPLDCPQTYTMLLDLEQLVCSFDGLSGTRRDDNASSVHSTCDIDAWEYWTHCTSTKGVVEKLPSTTEEILQKVSGKSAPNSSPQPEITLQPFGLQNNMILHSDNDSVSSLKLGDFVAVDANTNDVPKSDNVSEKDFDSSDQEIKAHDSDDEFTDFHSSFTPTSPNWQEKNENVAIPFSQMNLRETHISQQESDFNFKPEFPKIIPELQNKSCEPFNNMKVQNLTQSVEDDDFSDFQMNVPKTVCKDETFAKPLSISGDISFAVPHISSAINSIPSNPFVLKCDSFKSENSSVEKPVLNALSPMPILTPLQPSVLQPAKTLGKPEINWPDPGISEEELSRFETVFKTPMLSNKEPDSTQVSNHAPTEEDDWSDFVSVSDHTVVVDINKPNPSHLSVLDSSPISVQQNSRVDKNTQQSGHFVSHSSVVFPQQTKKTNITNIDNITVNLPSVNKQNTSPFDISSVQQNKCVVPQQKQLIPELRHSGGKIQSNETDDDWSDFVSNDNVEQTNSFNGWTQNVTKQFVNQQTNWNQPPKFSSWNQPLQLMSWNAPSTVQPNIITNPVHFDHYNQALREPHSSNTQQVGPVCVTSTVAKNQAQTSIKGVNSIPTISALPELDFMTPKSIIRPKNMKK